MRGSPRHAQFWLTYVHNQLAQLARPLLPPHSLRLREALRVRVRDVVRVRDPVRLRLRVAERERERVATAVRVRVPVKEAATTGGDLEADGGSVYELVGEAVGDTVAGGVRLPVALELGVPL